MPYELAELSRKLDVTRTPQAADNFFDFNGATPPTQSNVDRALTAPVRAEGRDDITRFEAAGSAIGHFVRMVREGRLSEGEAWEATRGWNLATLQPPWTEERLRNDFDRLTRLDIETHGPIVPPAEPFIPSAPSEGWSLTDWRADRFRGPAPARQWVVDGLIPAATPGIFAALGAAGKSMLALRLALIVSTYPAPQNSALGFNDTPRFFGSPVIARGAAVILTSEDDADEVHRRLNSLDPAEDRAGKPLYVVPMISAGGARAIITEGRNGPEATEFWRELRAQLLAIPDLRLVVLDPLSSFIAGDTNDNAIGAAGMALLAELAASTGAAVALIHHFAKGRVPKSLSDAREAIRGAGAWVDNGRWALAVWEADEENAYQALKALGQPERAKAVGVVYLGGLAKGNAPGVQILRTLVRNQGTGLLEDVTDALRSAAPKRDEIDDAVYAALAAYKKERPRWNFPIGRTSLATKLETPLRAAKVVVTVDQLKASIDRLIERQLIVETEDYGKFEPSLFVGAL